MKLTVTIYENEKQRETRVFSEGTYRIGRSEFCDIVLVGDEVSRSHIEIRVTDSAAYMTNMSNSGKVKLNQKPVETAELADGDEMRIGKFRITILHGEKEAPKEEPTPEVPAQSEALVSTEEPAMAEPIALRQKAPEPVMTDYPVEGTAALARTETVVEQKPLVAKLLFTDGPRAGEELLLETFEVNFGRSRKADVFLDDEKLSRIHAKITRVGLGYRLIDLNSRNGTYVNGVRVLEHPLNSFDVIEIGSTKIKFLIHDVMMNEMHGGALAPLSPRTMEDTKSLHLEAMPEPDFRQGPPRGLERSGSSGQGMSPKAKFIGVTLILLLLAFFLIPTEGERKIEPASSLPQTKAQKMGPDPVTSAIPKEYGELSKDLQKMVEGQYNIAVNQLEKGNLDESLTALKNIHENLPYYKVSRQLQDQVQRRLKEKQLQVAQDKAKRDEKADLQMYLDDGVEYLKEGDFDRAAEAFNSAIIIDPKNGIAIKGLKAAEFKIRDLDKVPPDRDPEEDKRKKVEELFKKAVAALANKSYKEAIDTAEKIRHIELKRDTTYLNEVKQIIDRARLQQKEEFEPFLIQAKEKFAEGDYVQSRTLCREMLKRDPAYSEAKECELKAKKQLNRLAKEAYTHGYILESMGRIEDAKQYWNRAKNYVEPGDEYYDKVNKKLENYQ